MSNPFLNAAKLFATMISYSSEYQSTNPYLLRNIIFRMADQNLIQHLKLW